MKNKSSFLVIFLSFFCLFIQADDYFVKGIVVDSISSESIPFATVSASSIQLPNKYIKRVAADINGAFELILSEEGDYIIHFESIGMENFYSLIHLKDSPIYDMGIIRMKPSEELLSELTVTAAKPLVKMDMDKIVYDTKSDPESESSNVLEMLRKVPMVTVDGEDNIQLKGSSNFKVYMNGKPSNMTASNPSQVLKSIPASTIKSIEVITEPGSKYDAEGLGGIINVVTERSLVGYTGSVRAGVETTGGYNGGVYFSTKIGKFGLTANLNYNHYQNYGRNNYSSLENVNPNPYKYLIQEGDVDVRYNYHFMNVEASYEFDSLNLLSLSFGKNGGVHKYETSGYSNMMSESLDTLAYYIQESNNKSNWGGMDMNIDYQRSFKKPDKLLTVSYRLGMAPNDYENKSIINGVKNWYNTNQLISTDGRSNEHTFQVDYTEPFNRKHVIEAGLKYILRLNRSDNEYQISGEINAVYVPDMSREENDLDHTQNILGVYGSYTIRWNKFSFKAGARYEYTESKVEFDNPDRNFHANFSNLIPSVMVSFRPTMTSSLQLSYNQRISRPSIGYLNPYVNNTNPNYISFGNPNLDAEISNSINFNYGMFSPKLSLNTGVYTSFTNGSIEQVTYLQDGIIYSTYQNIGHNNVSGVHAYLNYAPFTVLRIYGNANFNYFYYESESIKRDGTRYGFTLGGQLNLPWQLNLNGYGGYYSPWIMLEGKGSSFYYAGFTLGRAFFNKKLNITLRISEPFRKNQEYKSTIEKEGIYTSKSVQTATARTFGISINYSFGEMKEQIRKASRGISNDDLKTSSQGEGSGANQQ